MSINIAKKPKKIESENSISIITCPTCDYIFSKSARCPECGQLIDYSSSTGLLESIDIPGLFMELCNCTTKKQLVDAWNNQGLKTTTKPIDHETKDDNYLQFLDGSRIQFSADSLKLWTSAEIISDEYFDKINASATPVNDGSYRIRRVTMEKTILNFGYVLKYFVDHKLA